MGVISVTLKWQRARQVVSIFICWIATNAATYYALECYEATGARRPSWNARCLFKQISFDSPTPVNELRKPLKCRLMSPSSIGCGNRFPLLVFLHGAGQRGVDNEIQLAGLPEQLAEAASREHFPCFAIAPQCPSEHVWANMDRELNELIRQTIQQYPVDVHRIYLTGLSMGGFGCWALAASEPDLFAAVVPICGGGDPRSALSLVDVPIWAVHGDEDQIVPVSHSQRMVRAIRDLGGSKIHYTELQGVGHDSWTQAYRDPHGVLEWTFQQRRQ